MKQLISFHPLITDETLIKFIHPLGVKSRHSRVSLVLTEKGLPLFSGRSQPGPRRKAGEQQGNQCNFYCREGSPYCPQDRSGQVSGRRPHIGGPLRCDIREFPIKKGPGAEFCRRAFAVRILLHSLQYRVNARTAYAPFRDLVSLSHLSLAPKISLCQAAMLIAALSFRVACVLMRSLCT